VETDSPGRAGASSRILAGVLIYAGVQMSSAYMKGMNSRRPPGRKRSWRPRTSPQQIRFRDEILQKAQDLGLAVQPDEIKVTAAKKEAQIPIAGVAAIVENGNQNDLPTVAAVNIDISYEVPIAFPLYTFGCSFASTRTTTRSERSPFRASWMASHSMRKRRGIHRSKASDREPFFGPESGLRMTA